MPGRSGSTIGPAAGRSAAAASQVIEVRRFARVAHVRMDSWRSHRPMTLRRKRTLPSTPRSLVKFAARLASVRTGRRARRRPGPRSARDVGERSPTAGTPTTADAVSCEPTWVHHVSAGSPVDRRRRRAAARAVAPGRTAPRTGDAEARRVDEIPCPGRGLASNRPVVDAFVRSARPPGQPGADEIRDEEHLRRGREGGVRRRRRAGRAC